MLGSVDSSQKNSIAPQNVYKLCPSRLLNEKEFRKPEKLTCQMICCELLVNPVRCKICSTHFCFSCIDLWMKSKNSCPQCREPISLDKPERSLREELEDMLLSCINLENGCKEEIKYDSLFKHEKSCGFTLTKCDFCEFKGLKMKVDEHLKTCEFAMKTCIGCEKQFKLLEHEAHENVCIKEALIKIKSAKTSSKSLLELNDLRFEANQFLRLSSIKVSDDLTKASMLVDVSNLSGSIFLNRNLGKNNCSWDFKILGLKSWIAVGVSDFQTLMKKGFKLTDYEIENRQHGCYMASNNGIKWSYTHANENYTRGIEYQVGSVITINYDYRNKKISFQLQNGSRTELTLAGKDELYGVVILGGTGDIVEISNFKTY